MAFLGPQSNIHPQPLAPKPQANPYDEFRKQAQLRAQAQQQQSSNALQRRFAQLGGGPSGAQMKMEQEAQRQGNEDLSNQIGSINAQEAQANNQANQFQQQFGLEQVKTAAGIDMARRQQNLDELGQLFNQANEVATGPYRGHADPYAAYLNNIARARNDVNGLQGANDFNSYYMQLQQMANPMLRRLQAGDQNQVSAQGVA